MSAKAEGGRDAQSSQGPMPIVVGTCWFFGLQPWPNFKKIVRPLTWFAISFVGRTRTNDMFKERKKCSLRRVYIINKTRIETKKRIYKPQPNPGLLQRPAMTKLLPGRATSLAGLSDALVSLQEEGFIQCVVVPRNAQNCWFIFCAGLWGGVSVDVGR